VVRAELDGDLAFLYDLLLFHWLLTVDFADFVTYTLANAEVIGSKLDLFVVFQDFIEEQFDFTCF
jgi:hypothetical protein